MISKIRFSLVTDQNHIHTLKNSRHIGTGYLSSLSIYSTHTHTHTHTHTYAGSFTIKFEELVEGTQTFITWSLNDASPIHSHVILQ